MREEPMLSDCTLVLCNEPAFVLQARLPHDFIFVRNPSSPASINQAQHSESPYPAAHCFSLECESRTTTARRFFVILMTSINDFGEDIREATLEYARDLFL